MNNYVKEQLKFINHTFHSYTTKKKKILVDNLLTFKKSVHLIKIISHKKNNFDFLSILALLVLGYALMRSGTFLGFYLLIWNLLPNSQYYIIYNPIPFEIYLLLLSFFMAWYSIRLLFFFPKQFQIHLWIFHRVFLDNLNYFSKRCVGKNYYILEMVWIFFFFLLICCWPKYGLFLIWITTIALELYCIDNLRKPQILLFTPKWVTYLDDIQESLSNDEAESDDVLPEEDYSMVGISPVWTLWEYEEEISEPQNQPFSDFTVEDFEAFFAEETFIPPVVSDIYEDEFKDGWVNWFWLNLFYKILPILCFINIIVCILFFVWGIPEYFYLDMQLCDIVIQDFLAEYQRMLLIYTNTQWSSSWKWLMGGLGFRYYFQKYGISFFGITNDIVADNLLLDYKRYSKYTYYLNHSISRLGKIYSQIFPFYYDYLQLKYFFAKMQDYTTPLRETYLHKYFFYDDLFLYQQLKDSIPLSRSKRGKLSKKKKQEIFSWLLYKSKTWAKDYYYTTPAVHVFPEKHYLWLDLLRVMFVFQELDLTMHDTFAMLDVWMDEPPLEFDLESGQHFLQEYLLDFGDREIWLDFDAYEYDNELYTMLKHPNIIGAIFNYFGESHPLMESTAYVALPPHIYFNFANGKLNPEPDYVTQEAFDLETMKTGKFSYLGIDQEQEDLDGFAIDKKNSRYTQWIEPKYLDIFSEYMKDYDWHNPFEDEDSDFFRTNLGQTSDYEILHSYYHQANLDILPDLLQDMDPVQLQNKTFFSYVLRNDSFQYPNRRRSFLYNQMLQTFTYAASIQKDMRYNIADMFDLIETTPNVHLGQSFDFLMLYAYGKKGHGSSDYYKTYVKGFDSKGTRSQLFQSLNETSWYKYYYKVDTIMNYYDYMPSYRKFFMKTWPLEYVDTPYNFFGKINTVYTSSSNATFVNNDWIIYVPESSNLLFYTNYNTLLDYTNVYFEPLLYIL